MNNTIAIISVSKTLTKAIKKILERRGVSYPIFEGNTESAVKLVNKLQAEGYHTFISRGRTTSFLREHTNATIVNIQLSYFSFATAVNILKKDYKLDKIAILGFSEFFDYVTDKYKDVWGEGVTIKSFKWRNKTEAELGNEFEDAILKLKTSGIQAVIGNKQIREIASKHNLVVMEGQPDDDMIEIAIDEAEYLSKIISLDIEKVNTTSAFLNYSNESLLKTDQSGLITNYNSSAQGLFDLKEKNAHIIQEIIPSLKWQEIQDNCKEQSNIIVTLKTKEIVLNVIPIVANSRFIGTIISAQEVSKIQQLEQNIRTIKQKGLVAKNTFDNIIGSSQQIRKVIDYAKRIAKSESTTLITGETGVGKELFAQSIHNFSNRSNGPFVSINCAALSHTILESELFGYAKGAFTGALNEGKMGIFEIAHHGTLFLDEIGELPIDVQSKLLRVIQEREVMRIGDNKIIPIDVRIIASTNKNLKEEVNLKHFRMDLFQRISILELTIPPLNARKGDITELVNYFLKKSKGKHIELSQTVYAYLERINWVGNVRHLKNAIERLSVMSEDNFIKLEEAQEILNSMLFESTSTPKEEPNEINSILHALEECNGNRTQAASLLNISSVTLWRKLKKFDIKPK